MKKTLRILSASILFALAAAPLRAEDPKPAAAGMDAAAVTPAAAPPAAAVAVSEPLKLEKLTLSAAISDILQNEPKAGADLYRAVSDIYVRTQKTDKAISLLDTYLQQEGSDQSLFVNLANLYMQRGAYKEAAALYEKQVALHPENTNMVLMLAGLYLQQGETKKELALLEDSAKAAPKNTELLMRLSNLYSLAGEWVKAEETVKKVIALQPQVWQYRQLAQIYFQQDKLTAALAALDEGLAKLPDGEMELSMAKSEMYLRKGQKDKAAALLGELLKKTKDPLRKESLENMIRGLGEKEQPAPAAAAPKAAGKQP